jgi:tetratricopeptide (TPR) repeat protein
MSKAAEYFAEAIQLDPDYAQAHALLSLTRTSQGNFRHVAPAKVFPSALESVTIALALDESLPEAHAAMGWLALSYEYDWRKAEREFRRSAELAPSNFIGNQGLSFALQAGGRLDEALAASKRAHELDPLNIWPRSGLSEVYFKQHDYDATLEQALVILEMQPEDVVMLAWIGSIYAMKGLPAEAREYGRQAARFAGEDPNLQLYLAQVHALLGDEAEARELLEQALAQRDAMFVSPGSIAIVYTHLGEHEMAIDWLYRAADEYDSFIFNLGYPDFDTLRSKPRFIELCEQLRMPCSDP